MSKKVLIGIVTLLVVAVLFATIAPVFAVENPQDYFTPNTQTGTATNFQNAGGTIIGLVQIIGTAVAIVMLIWLGIKYVIAAPEEKAEIKKGAFIYVIAAVFIFAASNIVKIVADFGRDVTNTSGTT